MASVKPAVATASAGSAAAASANTAAKPATSAAAASAWKKPFTVGDLIVSTVMGTAFVFLTLVDWSFDHHVFNAMQAELHAQPGLPLTAAHPLAQGLSSYYEMRTAGVPLLKYWDMAMLVVLPLALIGLVKEVVDSVRGKRAPFTRHLLDVESLVQLFAVVGIIATQAVPSQTRLIEAVHAARAGAAKGLSAGAAAAAGSGGAPFDVVHEVRTLSNAHFLVFILNLLQWFVPFWRWRLQSKQDGIIAAEAAAETKAAEKATLAAAKAEKLAAAKAQPTPEQVQARMEAAEAAMEQHDAAEADGGLRQRK